MDFRIGKYEIRIDKSYVPKGFDLFPKTRGAALESERYAHVVGKALRDGPKSRQEVDEALKVYVGARAAINIRHDMERHGVIEYYEDRENKKHMVKLRTS